MQSADDLSMDRTRVQAAAEGFSVNSEAASVVRVAIRQAPLDFGLGKHATFQSQPADYNHSDCVFCIKMNFSELYDGFSIAGAS